MDNSPIILALDNLEPETSERLVREFKNRLWAAKVHTRIFRPDFKIIRRLYMAGAPRVWADLKHHDIPTVIEEYVEALVNHGASIISVHASGGVEMMRAAKSAAGTRAEIFAVTVLTSLTPREVERIYGSPPKAVVLNLAKLAAEAEVDGIVCSPQEVHCLAGLTGIEGIKLITPGVRTAGAAAHDQSRTSTPRQALENGATHVVIGREVTEAYFPTLVFDSIWRDLTAA